MLRAVPKAALYRVKGEERKANPSLPAARAEEGPMTTHATTATAYDEPCPGCDQTDGVYWVTSTPDTDSWSCRDCGTERTITVELPQVVR